MTRIAILGAGGIARMMARTLRMMKARGEAVELYAIGSRSQERADSFAREEEFTRAYGSYEALVQDPQVDLIYVASPHSEHAANMRLCVQAGKAVLCEKAFTANAKQAREVLAEAEAKGVLVTEAIWTRYQPALGMIHEMIGGDAIGQVRGLTANLCYPVEHVQRMWDPSLAGGALLDLGVYPLNFALMVLGSDVERIEGSAMLQETGVDRDNNFHLYYADGQVAHLHSCMSYRGDSRGIIYGTRGRIEVENINNPSSLALYQDQPDGSRALVETRKVPEQLTGYEYEVHACIRALEAGRIECPEMPHAETIRVMEIMDQLRAAWGVRYPFE